MIEAVSIMAIGCLTVLGGIVAVGVPDPNHLIYYIAGLIAAIAGVPKAVTAIQQLRTKKKG